MVEFDWFNFGVIGPRVAELRHVSGSSTSRAIALIAGVSGGLQ
jgi:hypothetical protein